MVATELDGRTTLRMSIGSPQTQPRHVAAAWDLICAEADRQRGGSSSGPGAQRAQQQPAPAAP